jgi:hypothetical protein
MSDITNQLTLSAAKAPRTEEAQLMLEAAEEIARLRLTDAEREAVEYAAAFIHAKGLHRQSKSMVDDAATLRKLLERLT